MSEPKHEQVKTIPDTPQAKRQLEHASVPTTAMRTQACGRAETLFDGEGLESCVNELINSKQSLGLTMQAPISCKHSLNKEEGWDFLLSFCFPHSIKNLRDGRIPPFMRGHAALSVQRMFQCAGCSFGPWTILLQFPDLPQTACVNSGQ